MTSLLTGVTSLHMACDMIRTLTCTPDSSHGPIILCVGLQAKPLHNCAADVIATKWRNPSVCAVCKSLLLVTWGCSRNHWVIYANKICQLTVFHPGLQLQMKGVCTRDQLSWDQHPMWSILIRTTFHEINSHKINMLSGPGTPSVSDVCKSLLLVTWGCSRNHWVIYTNKELSTYSCPA